MIASDPCPWYPVPSMNLQIGQKRRPFAPALRGLLTVCLTFAYIIVGVAGEIACAGETLGSVEQAEQVELAAVAGQSDQDSKKPPVTVVDRSSELPSSAETGSGFRLTARRKYVVTRPPSTSS